MSLRLPITVAFFAAQAALAPAHAARVERARVLMGTTCSVEVHEADPDRARRAADAALDAMAQVEARLSTWTADSELARLNRAAGSGWIEVSPELREFLAHALRWQRATRGTFDPCVGALVDAWDLRREGRVPSQVELAHALDRSGMRHVARVGDRARIDRAGAWIDSGGSGKGWALDRAAGELRRHGVRSALLDAGGQVLAIGTPEDADEWRIAIAHPARREDATLVLALVDASASTSSQSESFVESAGMRIGHVLDPRSGRPVEGAASATVVARSAADADALSTAMLVMGPQNGARWARSRRIAAAWLVPSDGEELAVVTTPAIARHVHHGDRS